MQKSINTQSLSSILSNFTRPQHSNTAHPFQSASHIYATDATTAISITKESVTGNLDDIQFNADSQLTDRMANLFALPTEIEITLHDYILEMLQDNIQYANDSYSNAITKLTIDDNYGQLTKFTSNTKEFFDDAFKFKKHKGSSYVELNKDENMYTVSTTKKNVQTHVYFQTSELLKILSLFNPDSQLTISLSESSYKPIKFTSTDNSIQVVTMPYKL